MKTTKQARKVQAANQVKSLGGVWLKRTPTFGDLPVKAVEPKTFGELTLY